MPPPSTTALNTAIRIAKKPFQLNFVINQLVSQRARTTQTSNIRLWQTTRTAAALNPCPVVAPFMVTICMKPASTDNRITSTNVVRPASVDDVFTDMGYFAFCQSLSFSARTGILLSAAWSVMYISKKPHPVQT